jgi:hypothetical protein
MAQQKYASLVLGSEGDNIQSLGAMVAFLVSNDLLSEALQQRYPSAITRIRMQDLTGAAFLTTILDGELLAEHLNAEGRAFCQAYLVSGDFELDLASIDDQDLEDWLLYDRVSPVMAKVLMSQRQPSTGLRRMAAKVLQFPRFR